MLDALDLKLLRLLAADARASWADLAKALRLSGPAVADRVHRLVDRGVIRGFTVLIDPDAVNAGLTAFIAVTLERPRNRARFLQRVRATPAILECHHTAGDDDFLLKVRCANTSALEELLTSALKSLPGIARTRTTVVLGTVKETVTPPLDATLVVR